MESFRIFRSVRIRQSVRVKIERDLFGFQVVHRVFTCCLQADEEYRYQRDERYRCDGNQRNPPREYAVERHNLVYLTHTEYHQRDGNNEADE